MTQTKQCGKCGVHKAVDDFYIKRGKPHAYCKKCFCSYCGKRWLKLKKEAIAYKGGQCHDCKGVFHYAVFEFHHRDPSVKVASWTQMRKFQDEQRLAELDKCDMLCANCHRMRHVAEGDTLE